MLLIFAALGGLADPAGAHQTALKYVEVRADATARVEIALRASPLDVTEALGLPDDAQPSLTDALAHAEAVARTMAGWLTISDGAVACPPSPAAVAADADARFLVTRWIVTCPSPPTRLGLDFTTFFGRSTKHQAVVRLVVAGAPSWDGVVSAGDSPLRLPLVGERPGTALGWVRSGMDHIWGGLDHVAFVLALLLVVGLVRTPEGWARRPLRDTIRTTALIVTTFTLAHSLTLIAASLGLVTLPSVLVESVIAASIAYTAVEDVVRPDTRWRVLLTLGFGLIHGLGFAGVLAELLPPDDVVAPLLWFNLGVEVGQLAIVLVVLPLLHLAIGALGAARYRRFALPALATPLALLGLVWTLERTLDLTILGL